MVVGLRTSGLCNRTMTSPSSFCTCLWSTPWAGGLISIRDQKRKIRRRERKGPKNKMLATLLHLVFTEFTQFLTIHLASSPSEVEWEKSDWIDQSVSTKKRILGDHDFIWKGATSSALKWPHSICIEGTCLVWRKERRLGMAKFFRCVTALTGAGLNNHINERSLNAQPQTYWMGDEWTLWHHFLAHFPFCTCMCFKLQVIKNSSAWDTRVWLKQATFWVIYWKEAKNSQEEIIFQKKLNSDNPKYSWITGHTNRLRQAKHS